MKTNSEQREFLTRGGRPTLGDMLDKLEFSPASGSIALNGARMVLSRASFGADMRDQLVRHFGEHEAMILMLRLGYRNGREDAEFILKAWPNLDRGDAFTAGTRLHMVTGTVRVETLSNDFDFKTDKFSGDFNWHDSVEAGEYQRRHGRAMGPVCWLQTGYAAGYASIFFRKLVLFKETHCSAMGHKACRVVGKTVDGWGEDDPLVKLFMDEVLPVRSTVPARPLRSLPLQAVDAAQTLDDLIVAPVRETLTRLVQIESPGLVSTLVTGPAGTGRQSVVRWMHRQRLSEGVLTVAHAQSAELGEKLTALRQSSGHHRNNPQTLAIMDIETLPVDRQWALVDLIASSAARPLQVIGLSETPPEGLWRRPGQLVSETAGLIPDLFHALNVLPIRLPPLEERRDDIRALATALVAIQPRGTEGPDACLTDDAIAELVSSPWPGHIPQLRAVLRRAALLAKSPGRIERADIVASLTYERMTVGPERSATPVADVWEYLKPLLQDGVLTLDDLNAQILTAAQTATGGNVSASARLLGLSRAQMAYRLGASGKEL